MTSTHQTVLFVLVLDPGQMTGAVRAIIWPEEPPTTALWTGSQILDADLEAWLAKQGQGWLKPPGPACVLIERPPVGTRTPGDLAAMARRMAESWGTPINEIGPGTWKPWLRGNPLPQHWLEKKPPKHVRDCLGILWYWLHTRHTRHTRTS